MPRPNTLSSSLAALDARYLPLLRLWTLRLLLRCNGCAEFIGERRFGNTMVARLLGLASTPPSRYSPGWAERLLQRQLATAEREAPALPTDTTIAHNITRLGDTLGLDLVERTLLHFTTLQRTVPEFKEALDLAGELTRAGLCQLLAECLALPMDAVRRAFDERSRLARAALLSVDPSQPYTFERKLDVLEGLPDELLLEHEDLLGLFASSVVRAPAARLALDDYPHLAADLAILRAYLGAAFDQARPGVNVLLHGRPGTGKTELVRALAQVLGAKLLEIPSQDPCGRPRVGKHRFESCRFAQSLLAGHPRALLLFDEVEDVLSEGAPSRRGGANTSGIKGWVNQLLEHNPVPTFWVTNHLATIDAAYRRRFDLVLQLDVPPPQVRRRLLARQTAALALPARWHDDVAAHADLAPALIERAARVSQLACDHTPGLQAQAVITRVMNNTLQALGCPRLAGAGEAVAPAWRLDLLNADCDLVRLQQGLRDTGEGRLCLVGPPGTGKSAFGRQVALTLGRPLLVKRASDILSPYVGVAEREIARMFDEADSEGAVLLLDEADSLLRDRRGAVRSWEVTQVNEMLTQMESFRGIFIASTNLVDSLDEAAMRRFDARIAFGWLQPAQALALFDELAGTLGLAADEAARYAVARLPLLAPGDFAAVARGCRLAPPADATALLQRLQGLHAAKPGAPRPGIGFLASA